MHSKIQSAYTIGLDTFGVEVEVDISSGLPAFSIVGLGDVSVQESRERVRSAIKNSGCDFPQNRKTVNLAPACVKKQGSIFDLPIAIGILCASKQIDARTLSDALFVGEVALDGKIKKIDGVILIAEFAKKTVYKTLYLPFENAAEASYINGINIMPVKSLRELVEHLRFGNIIDPYENFGVSGGAGTDGRMNASFGAGAAISDGVNDFKFIAGQEFAKRAITISAAGGHNLLMIGPPGCGKTMLANGLRTILPPMDFDEAMEVTKIYSVAGMTQKEEPIVLVRPFREVHHTASAISVLGGGQNFMPGEISLAHRGILFFDEVTLFPVNILENLRQPIESGKITIARARHRVTYPSNFIFIGAMNPCPCGYSGDETKRCICAENQIKAYKNKISGPMLDRMDLIIAMKRIPFQKLAEETARQTSTEIAEIVKMARERQKLRNRKARDNDGANEALLVLNRDIQPDKINEICRLDNECGNFLKNAAQKLDISSRACHKIMKVGRTIADLGKSEDIKIQHIAEAMQYR